MARYYHLTSDGPDTNLQLYSLRQAARYWRALVDEASHGSFVDYFHERCVFVVCTIGLSVSQLLGQNVPVRTKRVPSLEAIFQMLAVKHGWDSCLSADFNRFVDRYDQCRHFGLTEGDVRHHETSEVMFDETKWVYEYGLKVWALVIDIYRRETGSQLDEFDIEDILSEP